MFSRAIATIVAAATLAQAGLALDVGANDDYPKWVTSDAAAFYERMAATGMRQSVLSLRFTPTRPLEIPNLVELQHAVAAAEAHGIAPVLALYPYPPVEIDAGLLDPRMFAAWAVEVLRALPQVRSVVVGNEPNQPAFWRPQFDWRDRSVAPAAFGALLAASYDAIKAHDPGVQVIGVGLSPRGNDRPFAVSNASTSPMRFLARLGSWYRRSGRAAPLMDALSFHPYPNRATDPLDRGYPWPAAGFVNLDRLKRALWDAFHDTPQPTPLNGLTLSLDEVGWQVDTRSVPGYQGSENVPVTTEVAQASIYGELVRRAACDPVVAALNVFGFRDDTARAGFQAGLYRADWSERPAAEVVRTAITEVSGGCAGSIPAAPPPDTVAVEGAELRESRLVRTRGRSGRVLEIAVRAAEGARFRACLVPASTVTRRALLDRTLAKLESPCVKGTAGLNRDHRFRLSVPPGVRGRHAVAARFTAESNPRRVSVLAGRPVTLRP